MATASATQRPRTILHTRASWSARDDRIPSAVWLGILWIGIVGGFSLDIPSFRHQQPPAPSVIYVHAFVFTVWLLILTAQVLFVVGDRVAWHKRLGWFAAFWACLVVILGPWAGLALGARILPHPEPFLSTQLVSIALFAAFIIWGFTLRKNPAAHRRIMILATVALGSAGFGRLSIYLLHPNLAQINTALSFFAWNYYGDVLLIVLMAAWDGWRGRLMRSFVIASVAIIVGDGLASFLHYWGPWNHFAVALARGWAKL